MGLGKTVQSVAMLHYLINTHKLRGPFLVVAPLSSTSFTQIFVIFWWHNQLQIWFSQTSSITLAIPHWQREFAGWTDINAVVYHGNAESRELIRNYEWYFTDEQVSQDFLLFFCLAVFRFVWFFLFFKEIFILLLISFLVDLFLLNIEFFVYSSSFLYSLATGKYQNKVHVQVECDHHNLRNDHCRYKCLPIHPLEIFNHWWSSSIEKSTITNCHRIETIQIWSTSLTHRNSNSKQHRRVVDITQSSWSRQIPVCFKLSQNFSLSLSLILFSTSLTSFYPHWIDCRKLETFLEEFGELKEASQVQKLHKLLKPLLVHKLF